ncbi:MAG: ABC transporter permease [Natronosporangium sp.]
MSGTVTRRLSAGGLPLLGGAVVTGGWWVAGAAGVSPGLLPPPHAVVATFGRLPGVLAEATRVTAVETVAGFTLAGLLGIATGVLLACLRPVAAAVYPVLVGLQAVPKLALAPLLVVTLGFGPAPKIVMVVLVCTFPIVLATATGLTRTPAELVELTRSLSASWWQTLVKLRLPHALPQIFAGLQQAAPLAVIGAVVGELFGATAGLGYTIRVATADAPLVYAALFLLAALSISLFYLLVAAERWLLPWIRLTTA